MSRREFKRGEVVNSFGIIFLKDVDPYVSSTGKKYRQSFFMCPICGKSFINRTSKVTTNRVKSCGCLIKENACLKETTAKDLAGQKFGELTAIKPTSNRINGRVVWECLCSCGELVYVTSSHLIDGHTVSCGCLKSRGEQKIAELLKELKINFTKQKVFSDCINCKTGRKLRFDFYLPDYNYCIEYDGQQHFCGWRSSKEETLSIIQERDLIKTNYCQQHNVGLIRIPYTDYDILTKEYIEEKLNPIISTTK